MEWLYGLVKGVNPIIPQIIGIIAVVIYVLSFQEKKRHNIILFNFVARTLFCVQYFLLGAFAGAVLEIAGAVSSFVAEKKNVGFIAKYKLLFFILTGLFVVGGGLLVYENLFSLLPIFGVLLHTGALWLDDERKIRIVSLFGSPFWFVYNIVFRAYGSAAGDTMAMVSIVIAMIRYRKEGKKKTEGMTEETIEEANDSLSN